MLARHRLNLAFRNLVRAAEGLSLWEDAEFGARCAELLRELFAAHRALLDAGAALPVSASTLSLLPALPPGQDACLLLAAVISYERVLAGQCPAAADA